MEALTDMGITYTPEEIDQLLDMLKFKDNQTENISTFEIYANGHLF